MNLIKVAAAALNQTPLDWDGNRDRIVAAVQSARREGASIVCLPELCITGYGCEDAFQSAAVRRTAWQILEEIASTTSRLIVNVGLPVFHSGALFNAVALLVDGRVVGLVAKKFLAGDGIHYEPRWFKPWPHDLRVQWTAEEASYPLGDLYFDVGGARIGFEICEDAWVAGRPGRELARRGVDIILNPSASHFAFGKQEVRQRFVLEGSRAFGVSYVYANLLGNEAGRAIYDGGSMIASAGKFLAHGPRFSFAEQLITTATIDLDTTRMCQARLGSFEPDLAIAENCIRVPFTFPEASPDTVSEQVAAWETGPYAKEEEFTRAVTLALCDYLRKSHSRGFVVSLSGGADSSAVASLVALMARLGFAELGSDGWREKLGHIPDLAASDDAAPFIGQLLTCVYQSTRNSSSTTRDAARGLAEALHARFLLLDVDPLVEGYVQLISSALGRPLAWETDDLALQNIQARARAPGVWLLANLQGALLLSTSNRSEAAVGYATMDGDTCGGLSPIAGIDKAFLRRWLIWLEKHGPEGIGPVPKLAAVNAQQPTAELRPLSAGQTDEEDLMPYELLDAVERAAIRDKKSPLEAFRILESDFAGYDRRQMAVWIERFFRLWCRNQWKRERYAPSFHLDDENLDPKTWCRFPILSGGFQRELAELRRYVDDS